MTNEYLAVSRSERKSPTSHTDWNVSGHLGGVAGKICIFGVWLVKKVWWCEYTILFMNNELILMNKINVYYYILWRSLRICPSLKMKFHSREWLVNWLQVSIHKDLKLNWHWKISYLAKLISKLSIKKFYFKNYTIDKIMFKNFNRRKGFVRCV